MKNLILGIFISLSLGAIANIIPGSELKSDLINKILNIAVYESDYHYAFHASKVGISSPSSVDLNGITCYDSDNPATAYNEVSYFVVTCDISSLGLTKAPIVLVNEYLSGSVSYTRSCSNGLVTKDYISYNCFVVSNSNPTITRNYQGVTVSLTLQHDDRVLRKKTIRDIILDIDPNYFNQ